MNSYEINVDTLAVVAKDDNSSIVYENNSSYIVKENSNKIIEGSCKYFGSTLEGRKKGTTALTGLTHKVPIIIEESSKIIFFPTTSPRTDRCSWISLNNIVNYERETDNNKCRINFKQGKSIIFNVSYGVINNQILRSCRLQTILDNRKIEKNS